LTHNESTAAAGSFRLELDGQFVPVNSIEGGDAVGVVVSSPAAPSSTSPFREKHLSGKRYELLAVTTSFGSARPLFEWIKATWQGTLAQKSGSVIPLGTKGRPLSRREFVKAVIAETTVPTLDGASSNPAIVTVRFAPELTRDVAPPMTVPPAGNPSGASLSSNFRLSISGLDCTRVSKIESFTVKQQANALEFPNLRIELAATSAQSWQAWFRSFVIDGNSSSTNEKTGSLSFLTPNMATVLATISFQNLGIFRLQNLTDSGAVARVAAELYCERMDLTIG
jgi:hypothetical protein